MNPTLMTRAAAVGTGLKVLTGSGIIRPYSPITLARMVGTLRSWGTGPAGGFAALALRSPDRVGHHRRARLADLR